jgi:ribonuclease R
MEKIEKEGIVYAHMRGFGFVVNGENDRFFTPPPLLRKLLPEDSVIVTVITGKEEGTFQVESAKLTSRNPGIWMGTLKKAKGTWVLEPDDPCFVTIEVTPPSGYTEDQVVCVRTPEIHPTSPVELTALPARLQGELLQVLGPRATEGFEQAYALAKYQFPSEFDAQIESECNQAAAAALNGLALEHRADLRELPFVTVDSATTQDFDDALYAEKLNDGWRVMVAIADVSHYVRPGTALDDAAKARGTSVYLPGKTVPMLPRALSAELCALKARVPRYAVVMEIMMNAEGRVHETKTYRAVVHIAENMTYESVFAAMEKEPAASGTPAMACVYALAELYRLRRQYESPALTPGPETPEPVWKLGPNQDYKIDWSSRNEAHKLVEAFMLLANQQVAQKLATSKLATFFRHQALPTMLKWDGLTQWAAMQGYALPPEPSRAALSDLAKALPEPLHLSGQIQIRSAMASASYHDVSPSHFSLGYETYTHFTSPIRRYADLVVHRLLMDEPVTVAELAKLAQHCSMRSRNAKFAERYVWDKIKKRTLVAEANSESFQAYVVSQSKFGVRAVVMPWQCITNFSGSNLSDNGFTFSQDLQSWVAPGGAALMQGEYLSANRFELEEFKSKTEVISRLTEVSAKQGLKNMAHALGLLTRANTPETGALA